MATEKPTVTGKAIRVAIVDDHPSVREGLRALLDREAGFEVCGEAGDVPGAIKMIRSASPDVVVMDIALQNENSLELIRRLKAKNPTLRILAWSMFDDLVYAERALAAGALGYINKREATQTIFAAIRKVRDGEVYVSETTASRMINRSVGGRQHDDKTPVETLSDRELGVFRMIGDGMTTAEISRELHLSVKTVETHRQRIKEKLNIENVSKLVREATQWVLENR